jgi:hypothetical protein
LFFNEVGAMSIRLTDLLIELSEPSNLIRFRRDPETYLSDTDLTAEEISALLTSDRTKLRNLARAVEGADRPQQFNRPVGDIQISELHVELEVNANEQVAVNGPGALFVDSDGVLLKGVKDEPSKAA